VESFRATIYEGRRVLLKRAVVHVWRTPATDGWAGHVLLSPGHKLDPGGPYGMICEDGRRVQVSVNRVQALTGRDEMVSFTGSGELPPGPDASELKRPTF